jgi:hypothetical protein
VAETRFPMRRHPKQVADPSGGFSRPPGRCALLRLSYRACSKGRRWSGARSPIAGDAVAFSRRLLAPPARMRRFGALPCDAPARRRGTPTRHPRRAANYIIHTDTSIGSDAFFRSILADWPVYKQIRPGMAVMTTWQARESRASDLIDSREAIQQPDSEAPQEAAPKPPSRHGAVPVGLTGLTDARRDDPNAHTQLAGPRWPSERYRCVEVRAPRNCDQRSRSQLPAPRGAARGGRARRGAAGVGFPPAATVWTMSGHCGARVRCGGGRRAAVAPVRTTLARRRRRCLTVWRRCRSARAPGRRRPHHSRRSNSTRTFDVCS